MIKETVEPRLINFKALIVRVFLKEFLIQLEHDEMNVHHFLNEVIKSYIRKDKDGIDLFERIRREHHNSRVYKESNHRKMDERAKEIDMAFSLDGDTIDEIYTMLESDLWEEEYENYYEEEEF